MPIFRSISLAAVLASAAAVPTAQRRLDETPADDGWSIDPNFSATIALGVAFDTPDVGIVVGGDDGIGAGIFRTDDGGRTFARAILPPPNPLPPLLLLDGAVLRTNAVVSGIFAAYNSEDAYRTFDVATGAVGPAQSVDAFTYNGAPTVVITGDTLSHNGIQVSSDGGNTFAPGINTFPEDVDAWARYAAFAGDTWFVSGGRFPTDNKAAPGEQVRQLTENVRVRGYANSSGSRPQLKLEYAPAAEQEESRRRMQSSYTAAIAKSTDGGRSWSTIYYEAETTQYFNQIACFDAERCAVVSEGAGQARILVTDNGGTTWRPTMEAEGSLSAIQVVGQGEAWAAGGTIGFPTFTGRFYHTTDFGLTWQETELEGGVVFDLSFPPGQSALGFATLLQSNGASGLARYEQPEN